MAFKKGDIVKVKQGVLDPDFGGDIGGWQGNVSDVDDDVVCIALDSISLSECPAEYITKCEKDGLDWEQIYLPTDDVESAILRDTVADLSDTIGAMHLKHKWDHLGKSCERIHEVFKNTKITDEEELMDAWEQYLKNNLSFPFAAEISEYQNQGPLQQGDKIRIHGVIGNDEHYGVFVKLRLGKRAFDFPLCDIAVGDKNTNNYLIVDDYSVWFANRQ